MFSVIFFVTFLPEIKKYMVLFTELDRNIVFLFVSGYIKEYIIIFAVLFANKISTKSIDVQLGQKLKNIKKYFNPKNLRILHYQLILNGSYKKMKIF